MLAAALNSFLNNYYVGMNKPQGEEHNVAANTVPTQTFWEKVGVDESSLCAIGSGVLLMNGISNGFLAQRLANGIEIIHLNGINPDMARKLSLSIAVSKMVGDVSLGLFLAKRFLVQQPENILSNLQLMGFSATIIGLAKFLKQ